METTQTNPHDLKLKQFAFQIPTTLDSYIMGSPTITLGLIMLGCCNYRLFSGGSEQQTILVVKWWKVV